MERKQLLGRTRRARNNLALKLILERRFMPELTTYFNRLVSQFKTFYIATGQQIRQESFKDDTRALLKKQYVRVSGAFSNEMRLSEDVSKSLSLKQEENQDENETSDLIDAALLIFINQKLSERSSYIDQTNLQDMNDSLVKANKEIAEEGLDPTPLVVGTLAATILKRKFEGRKKSIAMTETQYMSESTKAIEASVVASDGNVDLNNIVGSISLVTATGTKKWASILDGNTRTGQFDHVVSDGQKVKISEPFIVSGEKLNYPGDSSLGASTGNLINCRCSALYGLG